MSSLAIIYNGLGTDNFCVEQTINSYNTHLNDKEVQIQTHNQDTIWDAARQNGMKRKWIIFPGGQGVEMAINCLATKDLLNLWNTQENIDFIGHCAGSVYLGGGAGGSFHGQSPNGKFVCSKFEDAMGAYEGMIAAPLLPWTLPTSDPSNCKTITVQHHLQSSGETIEFDSCLWLGPAFPQALNCRVIRTIAEPLLLETHESMGPSSKLHQGVDLPVAILNTNPLGNRVFLQADHVEIDPSALDQKKFESLYTETQNEIYKNKSTIKLASKEILAKKYQEMQQKLMASNASRIQALRDGMALLDMPLKPSSTQQYQYCSIS